MVTYALSHLTQPDDQKVGGPIQDDEALLLFAMVRVMRFRRILEFGGLDGYSARNFLAAIEGEGTVYTVDINELPKLAHNHVTIRRNASEVTEADVDEVPLDLIFFDCHAYDAQLEAYQRLRLSGIVTEKTVLAFHDTNLLPSQMFHPSYPVEGGWRHVEVEPRLVNHFKRIGYDVFCLHTQASAHSHELPYRWGLTIASRFRPLAVRGTDPQKHTVLDVCATENDVEAMFQTILKRPVDNDGYRNGLVSGGTTVRQILVDMRNSNELKSQVRKELAETDGYGNLDAPATEKDVEVIFESIMRRPVGNDEYRKHLVSTGITSRALLLTLRESLEFKNLIKIEHERAEIENRETQRQSVFYRCPQDLVVTPTDIKRILIVGSCLSTQLTRMRPACISEFYSFGQDLPEHPLQEISDYDFQVIQIPLRSVLPDNAFVQLKQTDLQGHENLFAHAANAVQEYLRRSMRWNKEHGILTFVFPFLVPQQNLVGRLMHRYTLCNPVYFVEQLNMVLATELQFYPGSYFFEVNEILATYGKRYVQEDMVWAFNHGSYLTDFDSQHDKNRAEPAEKATHLYDLKVAPVMLAIWEELTSLYRTVRQEDTVKMVVVDLDDTLWRGTVAELGVEHLPTSEGWPIALWEALKVVKRRGILLAIISKNEEALIVDAWDRILDRNLLLEDFAVRRINWLPKSENMADILAQVNLLPQNVLYIDDNPTQRAEIQATFPDIRVLGGSPLTWRHILLWSAETQIFDITDESSARTEMVKAQVVREAQRHALSREEFLASLHVRLNLILIGNVSHARFSRALELINKTNQFNTTGQRWTYEGCVAAFEAGDKFYAFEVADIYTEYGLVGVLVVNEVGIRQFVMSCRIMGLEAELAAVALIIESLKTKGIENIYGAMIGTDRNLPCRDVYSRCGFKPTEGGWIRATVPSLSVPAHIRVSATETAPSPTHPT